MRTISEAQQIRNKYTALANSEIEALQSTCPHTEITDWLEYHWAPAHGTGTYFKICKRCDKIMHEKTYCRQFEWGKHNSNCGKEIVDGEIVRLSELVHSGKFTYDAFRYSEIGPDKKIYRTISLQEPCCKECFNKYIAMLKSKKAKQE